MNEASETPVSWRAVGADAPIVASDGVEVGRVADVAALPDADIFHGIVFQDVQAGHHVLAPAADVDRITDRAVYLRVSSEATHQYEPFEQLHIKRLGLSGILGWKHLGWQDREE